MIRDGRHSIEVRSCRFLRLLDGTELCITGFLLADIPPSSSNLPYVPKADPRIMKVRDDLRPIADT